MLTARREEEDTALSCIVVCETRADSVTAVSDEGRLALVGHTFVRIHSVSLLQVVGMETEGDVDDLLQDARFLLAGSEMPGNLKVGTFLAWVVALARPCVGMGHWTMIILPSKLLLREDHDCESRPATFFMRLRRLQCSEVRHRLLRRPSLEMMSDQMPSRSRENVFRIGFDIRRFYRAGLVSD